MSKRCLANIKSVLLLFLQASELKMEIPVRAPVTDFEDAYSYNEALEKVFDANEGAWHDMTSLMKSADKVLSQDLGESWLQNLEINEAEELPEVKQEYPQVHKSRRHPYQLRNQYQKSMEVIEAYNKKEERRKRRNSRKNTLIKQEEGDVNSLNGTDGVTVTQVTKRKRGRPRGSKSSTRAPKVSNKVTQDNRICNFDHRSGFPGRGRWVVAIDPLSPETLCKYIPSHQRN